MSNAYPWNDSIRDFTARKAIGRFVHNVGKFWLVIAALLCPPSLLGWLYSYFGFEWSNDTWWKRGMILFGVGLPVTAVIATIDPFLLIAGPWHLVEDVLADRNWAWSAIEWVLLGAAPGLTLVGIASMSTSYHYEFASQKYLRPVKKYGWLYKRRVARNTEALREGTTPDKEHIAFGLHDKDTLPWRSRRHGMIVGRSSVGSFGHGLILGSNGSGKSVQGVNIFDQWIERGGAGIYHDYKGSKKIEQALRDIAERYGRPFYSFSVYGTSGSDGVYYDPLDFPALPTDKASIIISAMPFAEGGGATHYKNMIEAFLPVQIDIMEAVGKRPGEGTFDFLANTCSLPALKERIAEWTKDGDPAKKARATEWIRKLGNVDTEAIGGLRSNLLKIINSGGDYLRPPTHEGARILDIRKAAAEGAVVYFSLTTSLDATSVVTIGSLATQDIIAMIGQRVTNADADQTPILFMPDETSVLEERAALLDNVLRQAREAQVWLWPIAQSLAAWPESTRSEVLSNAMTKIIFNVPDKLTQDYLVGGLSQVPWLTTQMGQESEARAGGRQEMTNDGRGFAKVDKGNQLNPGDLNLRDRQAWIYFNGGRDTWLTIKPFRHRRIRGEEIEQDIARISTIPRASVLRSLDGAGAEDPQLAEAHRQLVADATMHQAARENGEDVVPIGAIEPVAPAPVAQPAPVVAAAPAPFTPHRAAVAAPVLAAAPSPEMLAAARARAASAAAVTAAPVVEEEVDFAPEPSVPSLKESLDQIKRRATQGPAPAVLFQPPTAPAPFAPARAVAKPAADTTPKAAEPEAFQFVLPGDQEGPPSS